LKIFPKFAGGILGTLAAQCGLLRLAQRSTVNEQIAPVSARQLKEMDGRVASST